MTITTHELAAQLLACEDLPVNASIDISTGDDDADRRIFTDLCFGVNDATNFTEIIIMFGAQPVDNSGVLI